MPYLMMGLHACRHYATGYPKYSYVVQSGHAKYNGMLISSTLCIFTRYDKGEGTRARSCGIPYKAKNCTCYIECGVPIPPELMQLVDLAVARHLQ